MMAFIKGTRTAAPWVLKNLLRFSYRELYGSRVNESLMTRRNQDCSADMTANL